MTSMLEQAVIDANTLREAAQRTAEQEIVKKYKEEIQEAINVILEQDEEEDILGGDELDMGDTPAEEDPLASELPMAATAGEKLCPCPDEDEEIEINFDELAALSDEEEEPMDDLGGLEDDNMALQEEETSVEVPSYLGPELHKYHMGMGDSIYKVGSLAFVGKPVPVDLLDDAVSGLESMMDKVEPEDQDELQGLIDELMPLLPQGPNHQERGMMEEDIEIPDDVIDSVMEALKVDYQNVPKGWDVGATESEVAEATEAAAAAAQDDDNKEYNKDLKKALGELETLKEEKSQLDKQIKTLAFEYNKVKSIAQKAGEKLNEMSVKNAKLFYQNRILTSGSLNERQKTKLVEAISKVGSVGEAKLAYETLQEAISKVDKTERKAPVTLDEAVAKGNHVLNANKPTQKEKVANPEKLRMQVLAGIKKVQ